MNWLFLFIYQFFNMSCCQNFSDEKDQKDMELPQTQEEIPEPPPSSAPSQYLSKYQQYLNQFDIQHTLQKYDQEFRKHKIAYERNFKEKDLNITILAKTKGSQIITLSVAFSHFIFQITLLNFAKKSQPKELHFLGEGTYGSVYACKFTEDSQTFVVKHIAYDQSFQEMSNINSQVIRKRLKQTIQQYCFYKLFSVLKIGPAISNHFGFDIIVYNNAIQFSMELCTKPRFQTLKSDLCSSLKLMHSLNFVHGDIKVENIMWSSTYEKNVFIDFGVSLVLQQNIGCKTFTYYFGTYDYSCQDMKQVLIQRKMNYVDLYYNDLYGLQKSLRNLAAAILSTRKMDIMVLEKTYMNMLLNIQIIYYIFQNDIQNVRFFLRNNRNIELLQETIFVFIQFEATVTLSKIFKVLAEMCPVPERIYQKITLYLKRKILQLSARQSNVKQFQQRMIQINSNFKGNVNEKMLFIMLLQNQNVTPNAAYEKKNLIAKIQQSSPKQEALWQNVAKFCRNLYATIQDQNNVFEVIKSKVKIKKWKIVEFNQFTMTLRAHQIAQMAINQYKVNLFEKFKNISQQEKKDFLTKLTFFSPDLYKLAELSEKIFPSHISYEQRFQQIYQVQLIKSLDKISSEWEKVDQQKNRGILKLIYKYFQSFHKKCIESSSSDQNFFQLFSNFEPAKRSFTLSSLKYCTLFLQVKSSHQLLKQILLFLKNSTILYYSQFFFKQFQVLYLILRIRSIYNLISVQQFKEELKNLIRKDKLFFQEFDYSILARFYIFLHTFCENISEDMMERYKDGLFQVIQMVAKQNQYNFSIKGLFYLVSILRNLPPYPENEQRVNFIKKISEKVEQFEQNNDGNMIQLIEKKIDLLVDYEIIDFHQQHCMTKKLINQNQKLFYQIHIVSKFQQLILRSIQLSIQCQQFPEKQFNFLRYFALNLDNDSSNIFLYPCTGIALATCFSISIRYQMEDTKKQEKIFQEYFTMLCNLIEKSHKNGDTELNIAAYIYLHLFIDKYLQFANKPTIRFYDALGKLYQSQPNYFYENYSNSIIIIERLFCQCFFYDNLSVVDCEKLNPLNLFSLFQQLLILAGYFLPHCNFAFARSFLTKMDYWSSLLLDKKVIYGSSKRKQIQIYLRSLRNHQYQTDELVLYQISKLFTPKKGDSSQIYQAVTALTRLKLYLLMQNKIKSVKSDYFSNYNKIFKVNYDKMINKTVPHESDKQIPYREIA